MSVLMPASFFLTFVEVRDMFRRCIIVMTRNTGIRMLTTSASLHSMVNMITRDPTTVRTLIRRSSGP